MPRSNPWADDAGDASLEFVTAGVLLLVPLVYLVVALSVIQAAAFAAEGAARQGARAYVLSDTGEQAVTRAVEFALADHSVDAASVNVEIACSPAPTACHTPQGYVTVTVDLVVRLPLVPAIGSLAEVPIQAASTQQVSRFWGTG